jgi:IS30 family transposase
MADDPHLRAIEVRVAALLALELDTRLKQDSRSRSKPRSLDKLLSDAGLEAAEIAPLLGKSPTAVRQALQRSPGRKRKATSRKSSTRKSTARKKT